ncbi:Peroxidase 13 [Bienertia sinuspersici]
MGSKLQMLTTLQFFVCRDVVLSPANANLGHWLHNHWSGWPHWGGWPFNDNHGDGKGGLRVGFYDYSCPQAENIIQDVVRTSLYNDPGISAAIIRLYFHNCFVKGVMHPSS